MRVTITVEVWVNENKTAMREPTSDELNAIILDLAAKHEAAYWETEDGSLEYLVQEPMVSQP